MTSCAREVSSVPTSRKPLTLSVEPVDVISTMISAIPRQRRDLRRARDGHDLHILIALLEEVARDIGEEVATLVPAAMSSR